VVKAARDHGATHVWANVLYLRPGTREHFLEKLADTWPELIPFYEQLYGPRSYLSDKETRPIRGRLQQLPSDHKNADRREVRLEVRAPAPAPSEQLQLVLSTDAEAISKHAA
jgi:hypothetical protein